MSRLFPNGIDLGGNRGINVGDPSANTDAANKQYVDNTARGLAWKDAVVAASTAAVTLTAPGATLDGVTLANGDRILLVNQATASQNGIWTFNGSAATLTRPADYAAASVQKAGTAVDVLGGTTNGDKIFHITTPDTAVTVDTTSTTWSQMGGGVTYTGSNGVQVAGSAITGVAAPSGGLSVGASGFSIDTSIVTRKYAANYGDGSTTSITITHALGTRDVEVQVFDNTSFAQEEPDIIRTTTNTVTLVYATAPALNAKRVVVQG